MVIIGFGCGLGNQMFQYAFYLSLKKRHPELEVKADIYYAFSKEHNGFELDRVFGINLPGCTRKERKKYSDIPIRKTKFTQIIIRLKHSLGVYKKSFYHQPDYTEYFPDVYQISRSQPKYLLGIWANENYFKDLKAELQLDIFKFQLPLNKSSKIYKQHILGSCSISIHVRRGDYIQYGNYVLGKAYYSKAIAYMEEHLQSKIQYFVFSDDMSYARNLFSDMSNVEYVVGNDGNNSWMDMYLMSLCQHNIIANSSFSFWGAYLNKNKDKIVVASNKPFVRCKCPFVCDSWIVIEEN